MQTVVESVKSSARLGRCISDPYKYYPEGLPGAFGGPRPIPPFVFIVHHKEVQLPLPQVSAGTREDRCSPSLV